MRYAPGIVALVIALVVTASPRAEGADGAAPGPLQAVQQAAVRVRFHLRYDGDDSPSGTGFRYTCPNCGNTHSRRLGEEIEQERQPEAAGYLVGEDLVVTGDPELESRFIERIEVISGEEVIEATPHSLALGQSALFLQLERAPADRSLLTFSTDVAGPYQSVSYIDGNARWHIAARPAREITSLADDGSVWVTIDEGGVVFGATDRPVTIRFDEAALPGADWKSPPGEWEVISWSERNSMLAAARDQWSKGIVHTSLEFRSPRQDTAGGMMMGYGGYGGGDAEPQWDGVGLVLDARRVLVLANLSPERTGRLERITVRLPQGPVSASFSGTLANYGGLLVTLDEPAEVSVRLGDRAILDYRNELMVRADVDVEGEKRTAHFNTFRLTQFSRGWEGRIVPDMGWVEEKDDFLFDRSGALVAIPVERRKQFEQPRYSGWSQPVLTPATHIVEQLGEIDPDNRPLSEEEENRLAWLGIEAQMLGPELARFHEVAGETQNGATGALVTHVYEGSPADDAGLAVGDVLLRIYVEGRNEPFVIQPPPDMADMFGGAFPWEMLDELPQEYFGQLPTPWGAAASTPLNQVLTRLGAGTPYRLEYARGGDVLSAALEVEWGPKHYGQATRFTTERVGVTVRDITFEVRRYFQMDDAKPGVIVSSVESGSKAAVGGVRPFELITSVNGEEIHSVADFERALESADGKVRLQVSRMGRGRVVSLVLDSE